MQAGAMLALASLSESEGERRWLLSLAKLVSTGADAVPAASSKADPVGLEPGAIDAVNAIDMALNGEGRRAARLLEKPGVLELLSRYDKLMEPTGLSGGVDRIRKMIADWPICPECKNRRSIKDKDGVHLCPRCGGKPGPDVKDPELIAMVRTEAVLLSGPQLSWASQTLVDDGAPLRDPSLSEVAPTYGVDAMRAVWRDGRWETSGESGPKPQTTGKP